MRKLWVALLLAAWGGGTVTAFWFFEGRYLRPVARPPGAAMARPAKPPPLAILATDRGMVRLGAPGPVTVLNFWNPECPCSRFAEPYVARLAAQYVPRGVRFITLAAAGPAEADQRAALVAWRTRGILTDARVVADADNHLAQRLGVWAAPAAVILDARGRVAYVGAYNAARYCSDPHTAWAAQALAAIVQGHTPARSVTPFYGCQLLASRN